MNRECLFLMEKISREKVEQVCALGANAIFLNYRNLDQELIKELRSRDISINVEIGLFTDKNYWDLYPDSRPIDKNGRPMEQTNGYTGVCPNHPKVREDLLNKIAEIASNDLIDGVWLDFIRYPCRWEDIRNANMDEYCFCPNCLKKFKEDGGGLPEGEEWTIWKCQQITEFIGQIRSRINKEAKRKVLLGMFCVPWQEKEFEGAIRRIIGQDFQKLAPLVDVFTPMTYHKMVGRDVSWMGETVKYFSGLTQKPVLPIIQTEDKPNKITLSEFEKELMESLKDPSEGTIIFFLEDLLKDTDKVAVIKSLFK